MAMNLESVTEEAIVSEMVIISMVVGYLDTPLCCIPIKYFLGIDCFLACDVSLQVSV